MTGEQQGWELWDLVTEDGELDRRVVTGQLWVPGYLDLDKDRLIWTHYGPNGENPRKFVKATGALTRFVRLADADGPAILRFARQYGVLIPGALGRPPYSEPLELWRHYARQARALLNIAARLHRDEPGELAEWQAVYARQPLMDQAQLEKLAGAPVESQRFFVEMAVNEWLKMASVQPEFQWRYGSPRITLSGAGLFPALALQLMAAIARTDGLALCTGCGSPYTPKRRPRTGTRHYCQECRDAGVPQRDAARDYRARRRARDDY